MRTRNTTARRPRPARIGGALAAAIVFVGLAFADRASATDTVVLKDGRRIEGTVRETEGWVEVARPLGSIKIRRDDVARIVIDRAAAAREEALRAAAADGGVNEVLALAAHYSDQGRRDLAENLWSRVLGADPGNETAHRALGHEMIDGAWFTVAQAARRRGLVRCGDEWVEPEVRERRLAAQRARDEAKQRRREELAARRQRAREEKLERERAERAFRSWRPVTAWVRRWDEGRSGYRSPGRSSARDGNGGAAAPGDWGGCFRLSRGGD